MDDPASEADHRVARVLVETDDEGELYPLILEAIGEALQWEVGALWEVDPEGLTLECAAAWCSPSFDARDFSAVTRRLRLGRGEGLPGRAWEHGGPVRIPDLAADANFPRAAAASQAGLRSAFCFPIDSRRGVLGVIEFYSVVRDPVDAAALAATASLGSRIGQYVERRRAERAARDSDERRRAILAAALDCLITIDDRGRVVEFNAAAQRTFGYSADEAVGNDMADLIVPPSLRSHHREGFARYLRTGDAVLIGQRVEITAMRADGGEFPVELTITRINLPGAPMFSGSIRDITDRRVAEAEQRATRARIVEAGDAARRQIERDLHDGAQQRLVNVGLGLKLARGRMDEDAESALSMLDDAIVELDGATADLRELARGIHPAVLSDGGLGPALRALVTRSAFPVAFAGAPEGRLPTTVEATAYFMAAEALTNVARHAGAATASVRAARVGAELVVEVSDDGRGGAAAGSGSGLRGIADRLDALGGTLEIVSPAGGGTVLRGADPVRVVVADDSVLLREGIVRIMTEAGCEVVGQAGDAEDLVRKVRAHRPDLAIVDIRMPPDHSDDGLRAAHLLREEFPDLGILILSQYVDEHYALQLLGDGAAGIGYLLKDRVGDVQRFVEAGRRVAEGGSALDPEVVAHMVGRRRDDTLTALTPMEDRVLGLVAEGLSNRAVCGELHVSERSVERHITSIFSKLGLPATGDEHRRVLAVLAYLRN